MHRSVGLRRVAASSSAAAAAVARRPTLPIAPRSIQPLPLTRSFATQPTPSSSSNPSAEPTSDSSRPRSSIPDNVWLNRVMMLGGAVFGAAVAVKFVTWVHRTFIATPSDPSSPPKLLSSIPALPGSASMSAIASDVLSRMTRVCTRADEFDRSARDLSAADRSQAKAALDAEVDLLRAAFWRRSGELMRRAQHNAEGKVHAARDAQRALAQAKQSGRVEAEEEARQVLREAKAIAARIDEELAEYQAFAKKHEAYMRTVAERFQLHGPPPSTTRQD